MSRILLPSPFVHLAPGDEALELRDVGSRDQSPSVNVQAPDAFAPEEPLTDEEVAVMHAKHTQRAIGMVAAAMFAPSLQRAAAAPFCTCPKLEGGWEVDKCCGVHGVPSRIPAGYREGICVACMAALFVPIGKTLPLCPKCEKLGNNLVDDEAPEEESDADFYRRTVKVWTDAMLIDGVALADLGALFDRLETNNLWLDAATGELISRMNPPAPAQQASPRVAA